MLKYIHFFLFFFLFHFLILNIDSYRGIIGQESMTNQRIANIPTTATCYKAIGHQDIYISLRYTDKVSHPIQFINMDIYFTTCAGENICSQSSQSLFLTLVHEQCETTLVFSDGGSFDRLYLTVNIYVMISRRSYFTRLYLEIANNTERGLHLFNDQHGLIALYAFYQPGNNQVVPDLQDITPQQRLSSIESYNFDASQICIADRFRVFILGIDFGSKTRYVPKFQAIIMRVYSHDEMIIAKRFQAWPCNSATNSVNLQNPTFVLDDDVHEPEYFWTFEEAGNIAAIPELSYAEIKREKYFQVHNTVERLALHENWPLLENRIFVLEEDKHFLICSNEHDIINRWRSKNGQKLLTAYDENQQFNADRSIQTQIFRKTLNISSCTNPYEIKMQD